MYPSDNHYSHHYSQDQVLPVAPSRKKNIKKVLPIFGLFAVMGTAVAATVFLSGQDQDNRSKASTDNYPKLEMRQQSTGNFQVILEASTTPLDTKINSFSFTISANTNTVAVPNVKGVSDDYVYQESDDYNLIEEYETEDISGEAVLGDSTVGYPGGGGTVMVPPTTTTTTTIITPSTKAGTSGNICFNKVLSLDTGYSWPDFSPLTTEEKAKYTDWLNQGKPIIPGCEQPVPPVSATPQAQKIIYKGTNFIVTGFDSNLWTLGPVGAKADGSEVQFNFQVQTNNSDSVQKQLHTSSLIFTVQPLNGAVPMVKSQSIKGRWAGLTTDVELYQPAVKPTNTITSAPTTVPTTPTPYMPCNSWDSKSCPEGYSCLSPVCQKGTQCPAARCVANPSPFVTNKITPTPSIVGCKQVVVTKVSYSNYCTIGGRTMNIGYKTATYTCSDGYSSKVSNATCQISTNLKAQIDKVCSSRTKCKPTVTPTPTKIVTSTPTSAPTTLRACNQSCATNAQCKTGLACISGRCVNPSCMSDTTCACTNKY